MNNRILLTFLCCFFSVAVNGQILSADFAKYLKDKGEYDALSRLLEKDYSHLPLEQQDSLRFYKGWAMYNKKELDKAKKSFTSVSSESVFHPVANLYSAWCSLYLQETDQAQISLQSIKSSNQEVNELSSLLHTGLWLLEHKPDSAIAAMDSYSNADLRYESYFESMNTLANEIDSFQPKSYFLSGLMSALIPGSGKIYAGQTGAGLSSLLLTGALGVIAGENIVKSGWSSWNSLACIGLFGLFYLGNMYGSMISVKIYRERFYDTFDETVLATMHVPLRNFYR